MQATATPTTALERLAHQHAATWVTPATLDDWAASAPHAVLLLAGDPLLRPEGQDVAAVLPELIRAAGIPCAIGIAHRSDEEPLAARLGAQRWPALVCFANGRYAAALSGMHDWLPFVQQFSAALAAPPSRPPIAIASPHTSTASCS